MSPETTAWNPFMLMLEPEVVLAAVERSEKLRRLNRRMCHPLDKPLVPLAQDETNKQRAQAVEPSLN